MIEMKKAVIVVDVQNDFIGGSLGFPGREEVVPVCNRYIKEARQCGDLVVLTRDWHPPNSSHFAEYGGDWPLHCVAGTRGAEFHPDLDTDGAIVVSKGVGADEDAYSGFEGKTEDGLSLRELLMSRCVGTVLIMGLCTDFCVRATALDAARDFDVKVILAGCRAVNIGAGDEERAVRDMRSAGCEIVV